MEKMSTVKFAEQLLGVAAGLFSLSYGIITYFGAADKVIGSEGGSFRAYREPVHPIADYYMRLHGATTLYYVFTWYMFCRGSKARKRAYTKGLLVAWIAAAFTMIRVSLSDDDFDQKYVADAWKQMIVVFFCHIAFFVKVLKDYPADVVQETPLYIPDRVGLSLMLPYLGYFALRLFLTGANSQFFSTNKLEGGAFSLEMNECAMMAGSALLAPVTFLITGDAFKVPNFFWQNTCLHMSLLIPLIYKMANEEGGFGKQSAFKPLLISMIAWQLFGFQRLGAYNKVVINTNNAIPKKIASKAA